MFTISSRSTYGLSAVFGFGLSYHQGPIQIKTIAEEYKIPRNCLEQILIKLKNGGILKSFRGAYQR
jgi:Rrf2 family cysteine metabolism transcriptional repressor